MAERHDPWPDQVVEGVAQVGQFHRSVHGSGLTGTEIGRLLAQRGIDDPAPGSTKWRRLCDALTQCQRRDGAANNIRFLYEAMQPVRFRDDQALSSKSASEAPAA